VGELRFDAVTPADGPAIAVVFTDPQVAPWLLPAGRREPLTREECVERAAAHAAHWQAHGFGPWLVRDGDDVIGHGGLRLRLVDGRPELEATWVVVAHRWSQGVATAIGRKALALAAERGAADVVAYTRVDNPASVRVMEKLGMTREREFEYAGYPHVLYRVALRAR
jgi:ribosomal-protein-alanine N-acetyltransferase